MSFSKVLCNFECRVKWDAVFNHLSFEVLPTIGAAFHFYKPIWESVHFHVCMHSAALLQLLGVNESRIIIKETLHAKQVLLPATPYFHSDWILNRPAPFRGITKEVSSRLTESLLNMTIELSVLAKLHPWTVECISHPTVSSETLLAQEDGDFRYIVFLSRRGQERSVFQEEKLLEGISSVINKDRYRLVVVGVSKEHNTIPLLHAARHRSARIFSRAIVMMGPHGGAWNNLMFTPSDCNFIEFNPLPVEHGVKDAQLVRTCFLTGAFAKGGSGKYYNVEPTNGYERGLYDFYRHITHTVSQREILSIFMLINKDTEKQDLLRSNVTIEDAPVLSVEAIMAAYPLHPRPKYKPAPARTQHEPHTQQNVLRATHTVRPSVKQTLVVQKDHVPVRAAIGTRPSPLRASGRSP